MSGDAILFRSDAQCVRVNKLVNDLVVCLSLSVSLLIDLSPIPSFKILNIFYLLSSLLGCPSPSLSFSSTISLLIVPLHPSSSILSPTNLCHHHPHPSQSNYDAIRYGHGYLHIRQVERSYLCYSRQPCFVRV